MIVVLLIGVSAIFKNLSQVAWGVGKKSGLLLETITQRTTNAIRDMHVRQISFNLRLSIIWPSI